MRALGHAVILVLGLASIGPTLALAQEPAEVPSGVGVVVVDADELFNGSLFGKRIAAELGEATRTLALENRKLEADLTSEEESLTARRPSMQVEAFRAEADAFDTKVQAIRRAQDAKERGLDQALSEGRDAFAAAARPVIGRLMTERGAQVVLDRRTVFLWSSRVDITEDAIIAVDAEIGDGSALGETDSGDVMQTDPETAPVPSEEAGSAPSE